jgi:hypothetical protein
VYIGEKKIFKFTCANQRQMLPYQRFALCFITFYIALLGYLIVSAYEKVSLSKIITAGNQ